jgi:hypothetical protein
MFVIRFRWPLIIALVLAALVAQAAYAARSSGVAVTLSDCRASTTAATICTRTNADATTADISIVTNAVNIPVTTAATVLREPSGIWIFGTYTSGAIKIGRATYAFD